MTNSTDTVYILPAAEAKKAAKALIGTADLVSLARNWDGGRASVVWFKDGSRAIYKWS